MMLLLLILTAYGAVYACSAVVYLTYLWSEKDHTDD